MKTYNLKLSEHNFNLMMSKLNNQRDYLIRMLKNDAINANYYQNEINEINGFFDEINLKYKTNY